MPAWLLASGSSLAHADATLRLMPAALFPFGALGEPVRATERNTAFIRSLILWAAKPFLAKAFAD